MYNKLIRPVIELLLFTFYDVEIMWHMMLIPGHK